MIEKTARFDEIRSLIQALPERRPVGGGNVEWLAAARNGSPASGHARVALFAASHGVAADLPGGSPASMREQVEAWVSGEGEISQEIAALDCDLRLYDLGTERPTADSRLGPAMTEAEACLAASYGMMAVEPGLDLLALAAIGSGAALAGTLISGALGDADPLAALAALGGPDIAAMLGAILAARLAGIPVILDGAAAHAAAEIAGALRPDAIDHCRSATRGTSLDAILRDQHETPLAGVRALAALMALHSPS